MAIAVQRNIDPDEVIDVFGNKAWTWYAKEAEYRFNRRDCASSMLPELLSTFQPLPPKCD
jgi:hypothetical protein